MPLFINGKKVSRIASTLQQFIADYPDFKTGAVTLSDSREVKVGGERLVYVCQREYAVVCPDDQYIDYIGTEDATTCHILVIRHSGSGLTALCHCDGTQTADTLAAIVNEVKVRSQGAPDGRLEAHLVGGFLDDRNESVELSVEFLECFCSQNEEIHLVTACITDLNDVLRNDIHYPIIYGLAVEVKTGRIFPATFPDKGPDLDIRGALCFGGYKKIHNVYDCVTHRLMIGPYSWSPLRNIDVYCNLPDQYIRKYLSTSPAQEPAHFASHVRTSLCLLRSHPDASTLFPDGKPYIYGKQEGKWVRVQQGGAGDPLATASSGAGDNARNKDTLQNNLNTNSNNSTVSKTHTRMTAHKHYLSVAH